MEILISFDDLSYKKPNGLWYQIANFDFNKNNLCKNKAILILVYLEIYKNVLKNSKERYVRLTIRQIQLSVQRLPVRNRFLEIIEK